MPLLFKRIPVFLRFLNLKCNVNPFDYYIYEIVGLNFEIRTSGHIPRKRKLSNCYSTCTSISCTKEWSFQEQVTGPACVVSRDEFFLAFIEYEIFSIVYKK